MTSFNLLAYENKPSVVEAAVQTAKPNAKKKIAFYSILVLAFAASFVFGLLQAGLPGLVLTASALLPLGVLVTITLFASSRAEIPLWLRLGALIWGGAGATTVTFAIIGVQNALIGQSNMTDSVVVQAAIVEESAKALFLFGLFWFFRQHIRTPIIGAMLGVLAGAGFAYVENILYFANAYNQGGWEGFWGTFIARALMSFFLHSMATMFTGLFIGFVVSRNFGWLKSFFIVDAGLIAAMTVHGMWNGLASITTVDAKWNLIYLFFWLPFVAVMTFTVIMVRRNSTAKRVAVLEKYVSSGVIRRIQVEKMSNRKARRKTYKYGNTQSIITWERSISLSDYWQSEFDSLPPKAKHDRRRAKHFSRKAKHLALLGSVSAAV